MRSILSTTLLLASFLAGTALAQQKCNGHVEYCSKKYSQVSQVGTHDSPFVGQLPTQNQVKEVDEQLQAGIRFLQSQSHKDVFGKLSMCHTSCWEEDAGRVGHYFDTVKKFLDQNPNEVVTLLLTNGDRVDMSMFDDAIAQSGLKNYAYTPPGSPAVLDINAWPTLGEMIAANKRVVIFMDYHTDMARFPYILDEFSYFFETPFDTTDPNFAQCTLDRPGNSSPNGKMYIVNHFLDAKIFGGLLVPDRLDLKKTNAATGQGSIGAQVGLCEGLYGKAPKAVLVDYFNTGDVFTAERSMNGL